MATLHPPPQEDLDPSLGEAEACGEGRYYLMQETEVRSERV